jgi:peptidoglycan/LPS O-acetylase OafA/YrhL
MIQERNEPLQAARGIAALAVLIFHANSYAPISSIFDFGRYGVHLFFFISGYVIYMTCSENFDLRRYALARFKRIYLPYWPVGIFAAGCYVLIGREFDWLATLTLLPGETALVPAWTLQHEIMFYTIAAIGFSIGRPFLILAIWTVAIVTIGQGQMLDPINLFFVAGMIAGRFGVVPQFRVGKPLLILGEASYSIYLAHLPAMGLVWRLGGGAFTIVAAGVTAGLAYYWLIERPIMHRSLQTLSTFRGNPPLRKPIQFYR